jgi:uncharacterized membrane protein
MTRALHILNALLAACFLGFSVWAWAGLPELIPVHFDASGEPTRWAARSFGSWFALPLMALTMVALNYGLAAAMGRWPHLVNLPDKRRFLALSLERRERVLAPMREMLYALSVPLLLLFLLIQVGTWREALGGSAAPFTVVALLMAVLITPFMLIGWLPRLQNELNRQAREEA